MPTDLVIKLNGYWYDRKTYKNVSDLKIEYSEIYIHIIFRRAVNNKIRKYDFMIPKENICFIGEINE